MAETLRIERFSASDGWAAVEALEPLVYPPEKMSELDWRDVEWSHAGDWVVGYLGDEAVTAVGIHRRRVEVGGEARKVAGIGGVMTHPAHQRHGYCTAALEDAQDFVEAEIAPDFLLLFVEPHNRAFYEKRGWRMFDGEVIVEERGRRDAFSYMDAMVRDGTGPAPAAGTIDLKGKPW